jgi:sulfur carrier protein
VSEPLAILLNGQSRTIASLTGPTTLDLLVAALELKPDRIAIEHNGEIASRTAWPTIQIQSGDRLEIVHFVGGGLADPQP